MRKWQLNKPNRLLNVSPDEKRYSIGLDHSSYSDIKVDFKTALETLTDELLFRNLVFKDKKDLEWYIHHLNRVE